MDDRGFNEAIGGQMQPTRRKIILALKQHGSLTAAELAKMLGITSMGVRRHLTTLERDRLVRYELVQRGKGRPSYVYELSPQAESLFPKQYAALANELLAYMAEEGGEAEIIRLFDKRAQRRIRAARARLEGLSLTERVAGLTEVLNNDGYLAEWQQVSEDVFCIIEHNCAVHDVAQTYRAACGSELAFLQAVLPDAEVIREQHMAAGELACGYRIHLRRDATEHE